MSALRKGLPELPPRIRALPIDSRGYPIPWFVETLADGSRDFRIASATKRVRAVRERLCWVCGQKLGRYLSFVIGPMCAVNRNTSEPPCHRDCAEFSVKACPFLTRPMAKYRTANLPDGVTDQPGSLGGNPGAACIWIAESFRPYRVGDGWLIRLGDPVETLWYCEGAPATREQIIASMDARLPLLRNMAEQEGAAAIAELERMTAKAMELLPA